MFGKLHGLSDEMVEAAISALDKQGYSPFVLQDKNLDVTKIEQLMGFNEGVVCGLWQFAGNWVERQNAKCACYD